MGRGEGDISSLDFLSEQKRELTRAGNEPSRSLKFPRVIQPLLKVPTSLNSVLNVKALVGTFNQEKALVKLQTSRRFVSAVQHTVTLLRQNCPACDRLVTGGQPSQWAVGGTGSWVFVEV